jgi:hypothetical protein
LAKNNKDKLNNNDKNNINNNKTSHIPNFDSNNPKPSTSQNPNNFNLTYSRPMTMRKPNNSSIYFPISQVSNISNMTSNNFKLIISAIPNISENPSNRNSIVNENENKTQILNVETKKKDAVTQTEEIFFRM